MGLRIKYLTVGAGYYELISEQSKLQTASFTGSLNKSTSPKAANSAAEPSMTRRDIFIVAAAQKQCRSKVPLGLSA